MIVGIGCDIVEVQRINRAINKFGKKFLNKIFTKQEIDRAYKTTYPEFSFAKRFAAKEAVGKALGTGVLMDRWQEIEVQNSQNGQPKISLHGNTLKYLCTLTPKGKQSKVIITLSDSKTVAQAFAIIEVI